MNAFRQFVIAVTGYTKQEEIAGFFTNTAEEFMGSHSITDSHISTITDTILLLQYVEIKGEMARALNVLNAGIVMTNELENLSLRIGPEGKILF